MAKKKSAPPTDAHAVSFLAMATQYQKAANLVYESDKILRKPIYFMYMHAIELALKAYLRAKDIPIVAGGKRKHHQITELYEECRSLGLVIGPDDFFDIRNVAGLLEGGERGAGASLFQHGQFASRYIVDARHGNLIGVIEPIVTKKGEADGIIPGRAVRLVFTLSKPIDRP